MTAYIFKIITLLGGLALFLFGMDVMGKALERQAGGKLQTILAKMSSKQCLFGYKRRKPLISVSAGMGGFVLVGWLSNPGNTELFCGCAILRNAKSHFIPHPLQEIFLSICNRIHYFSSIIVQEVIPMEDSKIVELYWLRSTSAIDETQRKYDDYCFAMNLRID